jgi:hypothetical protein
MLTKVVLAVVSWGFFLGVAIHFSAAAVVYARVRGLL